MHMVLTDIKPWIENFLTVIFYVKNVMVFDLATSIHPCLVKQNFIILTMLQALEGQGLPTEL